MDRWLSVAVAPSAIPAARLDDGREGAVPGRLVAWYWANGDLVEQRDLLVGAAPDWPAPAPWDSADARIAIEAPAIPIEVEATVWSSLQADGRPVGSGTSVACSYNDMNECRYVLRADGVVLSFPLPAGDGPLWFGVWARWPLPLDDPRSAVVPYLTATWLWAIER